VASAGWKLVFNAHQSAVTMGQSSYSTATMNQDIAFASVGTNHMVSGAVVWLTTTAGLNEADAAMARWQPEGDAAEQYVVGWMEPSSPAAYKLGRIDGSGPSSKPRSTSPRRPTGDSATIRSGSTPTATSSGPGTTPPRAPRCTSRGCARAAPPSARRSDRRSQRLEILDEVGLLRVGQGQVEDGDVVVHHVEQRGEPAVVIEAA